jgi:lactate dehydrogenase-like 2-hydroxyacid dehydrogenase
MSKPVLVVTRKLPDAVLERAQRDWDARLNLDDRPMSREAILELANQADALLIAPTEKYDSALIQALPKRVCAIATFSVGFEHIDLAAAKEKGLIVTNTPDVLTGATAEIAMLLLLGAARRAHEGQTILRAKAWTGWTPTQLLGLQLGGKRLGILGMGRIGQAMAKRARAFDMEILYSNRKRLAPGLEQGATYFADPEAMLPQCQFFSLHCPASPEMRHFLNARRIALLPRGAVVVNTARGAMIDDEALQAALKSGHVAAAGLDVFENEPRIHPGYLDIVNAFLLPHMGSATVETRNAMGFRALDNLDAIFAGREPLDRLV